MRALTFHGAEEIRYNNVAEPAISSDHQVIVKITMSALCGSDLHVYHAREIPDVGTVMGHEGIGEIVAVGTAVRNFRIGDSVFSPFFTCCGSCFFCKEELSCRCQKGHLYGWVEDGKGLQGLQAEYALIPFADSTLYHRPDWLTEEQALLLCDIFPTGYFCADMAFGKRDAVYAVLGCGPVGLMAIQSLFLMGVEKIIAVDLNSQRLKMAEQYGARGFLVGEEFLVEKIRELTAGLGVDAVLEVVGNSKAQALALELVRPGGKIAVVGVHHSPNFSFPPGALYDKNVTYQTGRCPVQKYVPTLMNLIREKQPDICSVITHRLNLADGPEGYQRFAAREAGMLKTILKP